VKPELWTMVSGLKRALEMNLVEYLISMDDFVGHELNKENREEKLDIKFIKSKLRSP
jgi:hypothetical protein